MPLRRLQRWHLAACLAVGLALASPVRAESVGDDVDRVALSARLIADGYWDRAARVLAEVDETDEALDRSRFLTLRGLVRAREGLHEQAIADFRGALEVPGADPRVALQLAQSLLATDRPEEALAAVDRAGSRGEAVVGSWLLRARAEAAFERPEHAWVALQRAAARFPDHDEVARQRVFLLVSLGLYQAALDEGRALLARHPDDPAGWLALAESLRQAGDRPRATALLEEARLRFPLHSRVHVLLAKVWLERDNPRAAERVLAVAAELDPSLWTLAAECARRAGELRRALDHNARVTDATDKARQRLGLVVEAEQWGQAVALQPRLERLGLLEEDGLRYALSYAWFRLGELDRAETLLTGLSDPRWFRDGTALRDAMQQCRDRGWGCP